jgi:hypothetical protein
VAAGVQQGSPGSRILYALYTSGLIMLVEEYVSEAEGLPFVEDRGWVGTGTDVHHVFPILERCTGKCIEWAGRKGLQFETAKTEAGLFTRRRGHRKNLCS